MNPSFGTDTLAEYLQRKKIQDLLGPAPPPAPDEVQQPPAWAHAVAPPTFQAPQQPQQTQQPELKPPTDLSGPLQPSPKVGVGPEMEAQQPIKSGMDLSLDSGTVPPSSVPRLGSYDYKRPPEVQRFLDTERAAPNIQQYENKGPMRRILGVLAGIGAGAISQDPVNSGVNMYENITHPGYKSAYTGWQRQLAAQKPVADVAMKEEQDRIAYAKLAEQEAASRDRDALNQAYIFRAMNQGRQFAANAAEIPLRHPQRMEEIAVKAAGALNAKIQPMSLEVEFPDGKTGTVTGYYDRDPSKRGWKDEKGNPIQGTVTSWRDPNRKTPAPTKLGEMIREFKRTHGGKEPEEHDLVGMFAQMEDPTGTKTSFRQTEAALASERLKLLREQGATPEQLEEYANLVENNPDLLYQAVPQRVRGKVALSMSAGGQAVPKKTTPTMERLESDAGITDSHVNILRGYLQNPAIRRRIGSVLGRVGGFEQAWGDEVLGDATPEEKRILQDFRTRMQTLKFQETRVALGGNRMAQQAVKLMDKVTASPHMGIDLIEGALDAAQGSARLNRDQAAKERYGNQIPPQQAPAGMVMYNGKSIPVRRKGPKGEDLTFNPQTGKYEGGQ